MKLKLNNKCFLGSVQILVFVFIFLNYIFHDITFFSAIKIFLFQFFGWFVTGFAIFTFAKIKVNNFAEVIAFSYSFGAIGSIITYLLLMIPRLGLLLPYVLILESVISLIYLFKTNRDIEAYGADSFSAVICLMFLFIFFILSLTAVSFVNTMPNELTNGNAYYVDWPFWAGNNIAFTRSFPADNFRQVGVSFKYHYFSSILIAFVSLCTGVDPNQITFYFSSILAGIILVFSGYYLAARVKNSRLLMIALMIAVLFTDGSTSVTFTWHTITCPFGFDYGYAYGMMAIAVLAELIINDRFNELFIPSCLLIAMTTGCKGPVGLVILPAFGVVSLYYLFTRQYKKGLISGAFWLMSFAVVFFVFIYSHASIEAESGLQFVGGLSVDSILKGNPAIANAINNYGMPYRLGNRFSILINPLLLGLFIFRSNIVIVTLLLISIVYFVVGLFRKKVNILLLSMIISSLSGIFLLLFTRQSGSSQMYFMMSVFPSAALGGVYSLSEIKDGLFVGNQNNKVYKSVLFLVVFCLGISVNQHHQIIMDKVREGIAIVRDTYTRDDHINKSYTVYYADSADYEVFEWIKNNTETDAVIAVYGFQDEYGNDNTMLAGVFSERYIWNEKKYVPNKAESDRRNSIMAELKVNPKKVISIMNSEGVNYIICHADSATDGFQNSDQIEKVFDNTRYIVFRL